MLLLPLNTVPYKSINSKFANRRSRYWPKFIRIRNVTNPKLNCYDRNITNTCDIVNICFLEIKIFSKSIYKHYSKIFMAKTRCIQNDSVLQSCSRHRIRQVIRISFRGGGGWKVYIFNGRKMYLYVFIILYFYK